MIAQNLQVAMSDSARSSKAFQKKVLSLLLKEVRVDSCRVLAECVPWQPLFDYKVNEESAARASLLSNFKFTFKLLCLFLWYSSAFHPCMPSVGVFFRQDKRNRAFGQLYNIFRKVVLLKTQVIMNGLWSPLGRISQPRARPFVLPA